MDISGEDIAAAPDYLPVPLPLNTIVAKADAIDMQQLADLKKQNINVTFIDIDVFQVQETRALEARQQSHEHRLAEIRLRAELNEKILAEAHRRKMQLCRWMGEFFLKGMVFAGGFYLTSHGDLYSGNLLMGAVASTFAKGFIEKVWKNDP